MEVIQHFLSHRYGKPIFLAHRGESEMYPENTLPAFETALTNGIKWLELDIQITRDGVPVVIHDADLKRFSHPGVLVEQLTFRELQAMDVGSWKDAAFANLRVPSLRKVLSTCRGACFNIELKREIQDRMYRAMLTDIGAMIDEFKLTGKVIISSFDYDLLKLSKEVLPEVATGLLFNFSFKRMRTKPSELVRSVGADFFHCSVKQVNKVWMENLHAQNIPCNVYTVNKLSQILKLKKLGVAGVFSDRPSALSKEYDTKTNRD